MNAERKTVLEYELRAVRALRSAPNKALVREALTREEELERELDGLRPFQLMAAEERPPYDTSPAQSGGGR